MRFILICFLASLLGSPIALRGNETAATASTGEKLRLALEVHSIFENKCTSCHGAQLARPKGKFGYVLDLKRMVENPDMVIKGDPEKSELFKLVRDDEMPGDDAEEPPLTAKEKETVKRWIAIGAPGELPPGQPPGKPPEGGAGAKEEGAKKPLPLWQGILSWLGKFHPLSTHFPVALMYVAVLAEALLWTTRRPSWKETVKFLVVLAALGAVASTALGWLYAGFHNVGVGSNAPILLWHRWLGTATSLWAVLCAALLLKNPCEEGSRERQQFRGALLFGALLMGITGFLGSALVYGLDHYNWN